jgi:hypothetical protein
MKPIEKLKTRLLPWKNIKKGIINANIPLKRKSRSKEK